MPATAFGWALGYLSTRLRGAHGMYITTEAVESFVEEHYGDQIQRALAAPQWMPWTGEQSRNHLVVDYDVESC